MKGIELKFLFWIFVLVIALIIILFVLGYLAGFDIKAIVPGLL